MSINVLFVVNVFNTRQGAVNKIKCCDYQATYISETGGNWPNTSERHARNGDVQTANHIAEHYSQTKHQIDWNAATCITYSTDYYQRLALESWFTNLEQKRHRIVVNSYHHRTKDLLKDSGKTNYESMTGQPTFDYQ